MPLLGEIKIWSAEFVPEGWLPCDGRLLPIQQNQALYSIIGNRYGGDAIKEFGLPDLRGAFPMGSGQRAGQSHYRLGSAGGSEEQTTTHKVDVAVPLPEHTHKATFTWENETSTPVTIVVNNTANSSATPSGNYLAPLTAGGTPKVYGPQPTANPPNTLAGVSGGGGAGIKSGTVVLDKTGVPSPKISTDIVTKFKMLPAYLTLGFIICVEGGDYPARREDDVMLP